MNNAVMIFLLICLYCFIAGILIITSRDDEGFYMVISRAIFWPVLLVIAMFILMVWFPIRSLMRRDR